MGSDTPLPERSEPRAAGLTRLKPHWVPLGLITLAAIVFFAPVIFGGYWLPSGGGDLAVFLWPTYSFASRSLHAGQLPLWNPYLYSGAPFWADNQSSVLYPPTLLVMLLSNVPYQALEALVIGHVWLAGVAMYFCAFGLSTEYRVPSSEENNSGYSSLITHRSSLLSAVLFMFSDGFITHIGNLNLIAAAAWLPLVVLGTWKGLRDRSWRWASLGGAAWGLTILAGHAQIAYFTGLMIGGIGLWQIGASLTPFATARPPLHSWRGGGPSGPGVRPLLATLGLLLLILALGLGLSAGSWLPALEMAAQTGRAGLSYEEAAKFSLPPRALIGLIAPWVYGRGPAGFTGSWDRVEVGYIGAVGLLMSLLGAWAAIRRRSGLGIFLIVVGLLSFGVALGDHGPLHRLAYDLVPGFRNFRAPARFILLMNFAQAMLAGVGLTSLATARPPLHSWRGGGPPGPGVRLRLAIPVVILILSTAELICFGMTAEIDRADPRANFNHPDEIAWLSAQAGQPGGNNAGSPISTPGQPGGNNAGSQVSTPGQPFRIDAAPAGHWQQDLAALHGPPLYDIYGVANPLSLASYEGWYWSVGSRGTPPYNFLGVRYVLAEGGPPADATFRPVASFPDGIAIYENTRALPMAMLVPNAVVVKDAAQASDLAHHPDWDPRRVVYVENGPPLSADSTSGDSLSYTQYGANRIALHAVTAGPAYLVLSEVYYPGWVASIDGQPAPIVRANAAFRAVYIGAAGEHDVVLSFEPPLVFIGLAISAVSLLGLVVTIVWETTFSPQSRKARKEK